MNKTLSALVVSAFLLAACGKSQPVVVAPVAPVVAQAPAVTTVAQPTTELEKMRAVKIAPQPTMTLPVEKKVTRVGVKATAAKKPTTARPNPRVVVEKKAYLKAFFNKIEYVCIRKVVDEKIAEDIDLGRIRDLGNIVDAFHKVDNMTFTQFCVQNGFVKLSDVKEFNGKV